MTNIPSVVGLVYGKIYRNTPYLMVKTMLSCRFFSLNPMIFHVTFWVAQTDSELILGFPQIEYV